MELNSLALSLDEEIILTDAVELDSSRHSKIRKLEVYLRVAQDNHQKLKEIFALGGLSEKQVDTIRKEITAEIKYEENLREELKKLKEDPEDAEIKEAVNKFPIDEETREIMYEFADKVLEAKDKRIEELESGLMREKPIKVPNIDRDEETLRQLKLLEGTKEVYSDDLILVTEKELKEPLVSIEEFKGKLKLLEEFKKKLSNPPLFDDFHWMSPSNYIPSDSKVTKVDLVIKDTGDNSDASLRSFATNLIQYDKAARIVAIVSKEKPGFSWIIKSEQFTSESLPQIEISIALTDYLCGPVAWIKGKV
jgi:hypothetical protein